MTTDVLWNWFYKYSAIEVENYIKEKCLAFKILLVLDNAHGHSHNLEIEIQRLYVCHQIQFPWFNL